MLKESVDKMLDNINDFNFILNECEALIKYYDIKPVESEKIKNIAVNMADKAEAKQVLVRLISGIRVYHIEYLAWKEKLNLVYFVKLFINSLDIIYIKSTVSSNAGLSFREAVLYDKLISVQAENKKLESEVERLELMVEDLETK